MLEDRSISALQAALHGLAERQRAISDDIANVDTPYFRARRVAFEGSLKAALDAGRDPLTARPTAAYTDDPAGLTENNVDLQAETVLGVDTQLKYDLALRATGDRFNLVRAAVRGA
jgi:flagellar basal-body rod protein FlgB